MVKKHLHYPLQIFSCGGECKTLRDGCCKNKTALTGALTGAAVSAFSSSLSGTWPHEPRCSPQGQAPLLTDLGGSYSTAAFWRGREGSEHVVVVLYCVAWEIAITVAVCLGEPMFSLPKLWKEGKSLAGSTQLRVFRYYGKAADSVFRVHDPAAQGEGFSLQSRVNCCGNGE